MKPEELTKADGEKVQKKSWFVITIVYIDEDKEHQTHIKRWKGAYENVRSSVTAFNRNGFWIDGIIMVPPHRIWQVIVTDII